MGMANGRKVESVETAQVCAPHFLAAAFEGALVVFGGGAIAGDHHFLIDGTEGRGIGRGLRVGLVLIAFGPEHLHQWLIAAGIAHDAQSAHFRAFGDVFRQPALIRKKEIHQLNGLKFAVCDPSLGEEDFVVGEECRSLGRDHWDVLGQR